MNVYILLDRSGSMAWRMTGCVKTINEYVKGLPATARVTLATFTYHPTVGWAGQSFEKRDILSIHRDGAAAGGWHDITYADVLPNGGTPLYDAVGRISDIIAKDKGELGTLMILTDGEDNESKTVNKDGAKVRLDAIRARGWDVIQVGVEYDSYQQAASMGTQSIYNSMVTMDAMESGAASDALRRHTTSYNMTGKSTGFTDAVKKAMGDTK